MKKLFVSASNRRGVLIILATVLLIALVPRIFMMLTKTDITKISTLEQEQIQRIAFEQGRQTKTWKRKSNRFKKPPRKFDPNQYTVSQWKYLGLSEKQAAIVVKFSSRGIGSYEELSKIFVIPPDLLALIKDSLVFTSTLKNQYAGNHYESKSNSGKKLVSLIDLNLANEQELESLPMIGEKLAARIVKFRNRLGGFIAKEQLLEVYGLDANTFTLIENRVQLSKATIKKLQLNLVTAEDLKNHPYFNWNIANSIVKLRSQKGSFTKLTDILESKLIDLEFFEKVKPYLDL